MERKSAPTGNRTRVTSMGGLYDAATLRALMSTILAIALPTVNRSGGGCCARDTSMLEELSVACPQHHVQAEWRSG